VTAVDNFAVVLPDNLMAVDNYADRSHHSADDNFVVDCNHHDCRHGHPVYFIKYIKR